MNEWLDALKRKLADCYLVPQSHGTHDLQHVLRMERMYPEMSKLIPGVDELEYRTAVWLHNMDRCPAFEELIKKSSLQKLLQATLTDSPFDEQARQRIITAVLEHSKRDDEPHDSPLLQALRLADKWDRIGVLGGLSPFEWLGCKLPSYNPVEPFGYGSTVEGKYKTLYQSFYRIMEWYAMFPLIRVLVRNHPWKFQHFLFFVRAWAREVSEAHGIVNTVEHDIKRCLGPYYKDWAPNYGD